MSQAGTTVRHQGGHILVIKLGALGDIIHAMHAYAAIRAHHPQARIELLTTAPYVELARAAPWFDEVHVDARPAWWNLPGLRRTASLLQGFDLVYDLQTSRRSGRYHRMAGRPPWSGITRDCSYPHTNPARNAMHTLERQREQLQQAGVTHFPMPERDWLIARGRLRGVRGRFALLMPGSSKGEDCPKRWPLANYATLARELASLGITPVIIGQHHECGLGAVIHDVCAAAIDLTGQTSLFDLAALASRATIVVGNDTGPVHLAAFIGAPTVALFSAKSSIEQAGPRGPSGSWATTLLTPRLADLEIGRVMTAVIATLDRSASALARGDAGRREPKAQQQEKPATDR